MRNFVLAFCQGINWKKIRSLDAENAKLLGRRWGGSQPTFVRLISPVLMFRDICLLFIYGSSCNAKRKCTSLFGVCILHLFFFLLPHPASTFVCLFASLPRRHLMAEIRRQPAVLCAQSSFRNQREKHTFSKGRGSVEDSTVLLHSLHLGNGRGKPTLRQQPHLVAWIGLALPI